MAWEVGSRALRPASAQDRPRNAPDVPPEAHRPFLDALADLLAAEVVAKITVLSGSRTPRKSGTDSTPVRSLRRAVRDAEQEGS